MRIQQDHWDQLRLSLDAAMVPGVIRTASGGHVDFQHPGDSRFTVEDVALGLSRVARFSGQTKFLYTVAHHSVLVSRIAQELAGIEAARLGLVHDAAEAFMGDLASPLKHMTALTGYRDVENDLQRVIVPRLTGWELDRYRNSERKAVKFADGIAFLLEEHYVRRMPPSVVAGEWERMFEYGSVDGFVDFLRTARQLRLVGT